MDTIRCMGATLAKCRDLAGAAFYGLESWQSEGSGATKVVATHDDDADARQPWMVAIYIRDPREQGEHWRLVARGHGSTLEGARHRCAEDLRSIMRASIASPLARRSA